MPNRPTLYHFHDAGPVGFSTGPRREVVLELALDPVWNDGNDAVVVVRLGDTRNFEEVRRFFGGIKRPRQTGARLDTMVSLEYAEGARDRIVLELADSGFIEIESRHVAGL
jgi:hypothetical protein